MALGLTCSLARSRGGLGGLFYRWFRDRPAEHPSVNAAAELALMDGADRNAPSRPRACRGASSARARRCCCGSSILHVPWLVFLHHVAADLPARCARVSLEKSAVLAGLPLFFRGHRLFRRWLGGQRLAENTGNVARARRIVACSGLFMAGAAFVIATRSTIRSLR